MQIPDSKSPPQQVIMQCMSKHLWYFSTLYYYVFQSLLYLLCNYTWNMTMIEVSGTSVAHCNCWVNSLQQDTQPRKKTAQFGWKGTKKLDFTQSVNNTDLPMHTFNCLLSFFLITLITIFSCSISSWTVITACHYCRETVRNWYKESCDWQQIFTWVARNHLLQEDKMYITLWQPNQSNQKRFTRSFVGIVSTIITWDGKAQHPEMFLVKWREWLKIKQGKKYQWCIL